MLRDGTDDDLLMPALAVIVGTIFQPRDRSRAADKDVDLAQSGRLAAAITADHG